MANSGVKLYVMHKWYLSFAGGEPEQFLGACVVEAEDFPAAVHKTKQLGINPGGEVMGLDITARWEGQYPMDTLLSREQLGPARRVGDMSEDDQNVLGTHARRVCEEHNT